MFGYAEFQTGKGKRVIFNEYKTEKSFINQCIKEKKNSENVTLFNFELIERLNFIDYQDLVEFAISRICNFSYNEAEKMNFSVKLNDISINEILAKKIIHIKNNQKLLSFYPYSIEDLQKIVYLGNIHNYRFLSKLAVYPKIISEYFNINLDIAKKISSYLINLDNNGLKSFLKWELFENYEKAYAILNDKNNNEEICPYSWYRYGDNYGILWHYTDINNICSILLEQKILSKNEAIKTHKMQNDNASNLINTEITPEWVHDYARFYLRPKTPTQYRNEGFYPQDLEKNTSNNMFNRIYSNNEFWNSPPAHVPIPVFIGFDLKKILMYEIGFMTKSSLASKYKYKKMEEAIDTNLSHFIHEVLNIYGRKSQNSIKQTEVVINNGLSFNKKDIVKIIVRSEAEKILLLTKMAIANNSVTGDKSAHNKMDFLTYVDKIEVNHEFFYYDSLIPVIENGEINLKYCDSKGIISDYCYCTLLKNQRIFQNDYASYEKLFSVQYCALDVNGLRKEIGTLNQPYYILSVSFSKRYNTFYSTIYFQKINKVKKLYRKSNSTIWYDYITNKDVELSDIIKKTLLSVENSVKFS